jgi:hypothetical protein
MKKLVLNDRNQEISEKLPAKYATQILNSVISRSLENGSLIKELSFLLNERDLELLLNELGNEISIIKKEAYSRTSYQKKIKTKKEETKIPQRTEVKNLFFGFDE